MQTLLFRVYLGKEIVQVKQFNKDQVVIGRNPDLDIILNNDAIAPIHALIERRDTGVYLCDLGSESGITYQGQKVLDVPLRHGDQFSVGSFTIEFYEGLPKPKAPPGSIGDVPPAPVATPAPTPKVSASAPVPTPTPTPAPSVTGGAPNYSTPSYSSPSKGTFTPASSFKSTSEILNSSTGAIVEVVVTWRERVINTYHFREAQVVTAGYDPTSSIRLPPINQAFKLIPVMAVGQQISVLLFPGMTGELFNAQKQSKNFEQLQREGRISQGSDGRSFFLAQKELVKIDIPGTELSLWVRYVPETPKAEFLPWLDFSPAEFTAVVVSIVASLLMFIYTQTFVEPEEEKEDETEKIATFQVPIEKKVAPMVDSPTPPSPVEKVADAPKQTVAKAQTQATKAKAGSPAEVAPKKTDNDKKPTLTSVKPTPAKAKGTVTNVGGSAAPKPKPAPDISKMGLFADAGALKSLEKSKDTGTLTEVGSAAAAEAGERGNKPGAGLNVAATKAGPGGSGIAPIGIKGVGVNTPGGLGKGGPGLGSGISKSNATIVPGGEGESIGAGMDKEAIRRVVREHINDLRTCYEAELNKDPNLAGKLVLQWEIKEGGRVGKVSAVNRGDTISNKRVIKCCQNVLSEWRFPEPPAGMVGIVVYPFIFQSN